MEHNTMHPPATNDLVSGTTCTSRWPRPGRWPPASWRCRSS